MFNKFQRFQELPSRHRLTAIAKGAFKQSLNNANTYPILTAASKHGFS